MRFTISQILILLMVCPALCSATGIYRFNEGKGTTAQDSSGNGNDGIITDASYVAGLIGTALRFGTPPSSTVLLPQTVLSDLGNTSYFEAWVRPSGYPSPPCLSTILRKRASFNDWELDLLTSGALRATQFGRNAGGTFEAASVEGGNVPLGTWTKVAMAYDGTTLRLFVNDIEIGAETRPLTLDWDHAYQRTDIGNNPSDTNCAYHFIGDIDEVCIASSEADCDGIPEPIRYVALGDSFSSGEGAEDYIGSSRCHRSGNAYSQVTYALDDLTAAHFFACSGARTENLLSADIGGVGQHGEPPQLDNTTELSTADIVTVSIGGNDALFGDVLRWCYEEDDCRTFRPDGWSLSLEQYMPALIDALGPRIQNTLQRLREATPTLAVSFVLGYPALFPDPETGNPQCEVLTDPPPPLSDNAWSPEEQAWMRGLAPLLNEEIRQAAMNAGAIFVPAETFAGHEICGSADDSWFVAPAFWRGLLNEVELFHPDQDGQLFGYRRALEAYIVAFGLGQLRTELMGLRNAAPSATTSPTVQGALPTVGPLLVEVISPVCSDDAVVPGQALQVTGTGFAPSITVQFVLKTGGSHLLGSAPTDAMGSFDTSVSLPSPLDAVAMARLEAQGLGVNDEPRLLLAYLGIGDPVSEDGDGDGIPNVCDLCPDIVNPQQEDADADGLGDACDICPVDSGNDSDGDGLCADIDPCPRDPANDGDADGLCAERDNCPLVFNPSQEDVDGDLVGDACDSCSGGPDIVCVFGDGFESGNLSRWSAVVP